MDPRLKLLSHSSRSTLKKCARKFQLYRLQSKSDDAEESVELSQSITFAFGHSVGEGIQHLLHGDTVEQAVWKMYLGWGTDDLLDRNDKQVKSIWHAIAAVQKFAGLVQHLVLKDYELVVYNGEPACELSFRITFPDGFEYRGFVDAVLRHTVTGEIMVLECKTSSGNVLNPATFKNSAQAIGYSVVLDVIFPSLSSYKVLYLVYLTKKMEWETLPFTKNYLQRALWIQELLLDIESIKMYSDVGVFPMNGDSCFDFWRECEYINNCTLSTDYLVRSESEEEMVKRTSETYHIELKVEDLIRSQLEKA